MERIHVIQPTDKGGDSGEHQADYEVADGKHCRSHVGKSHLVDVSFEDGGGKTAEDIKDEQDGKAGVRKVESQGDISADYKTRIRIPILRGPK